MMTRSRMYKDQRVDRERQTETDTMQITDLTFLHYAMFHLGIVRHTDPQSPMPFIVQEHTLMNSEHVCTIQGAFPN